MFTPASVDARELSSVVDQLYLFYYCYVCTSFGLYCILFRRFLIAKIDVTLQLSKL